MRLLRELKATTAAGTAPASSRKNAPAYEGGVALALGWAQLTIGGQNLQQEIDPAADERLL